MDPSNLDLLRKKYLDYYEPEATKSHGRYGFLKLGEISAAAAIPVARFR